MRDVLERGGAREEGAFGSLLLLERRTPLQPNAPKVEGTGEIKVESAERATGCFTTHADMDPSVSARTVGVYLRTDPEYARISRHGS